MRQAQPPRMRNASLCTGCGARGVSSLRLQAGITNDLRGERSIFLDKSREVHKPHRSGFDGAIGEHPLPEVAAVDDAGKLVSKLG